MPVCGDRQTYDKGIMRIELVGLLILDRVHRGPDDVSRYRVDRDRLPTDREGSATFSLRE